MPARLRPPTDADAPAVLALILARDAADLGAPDFTLEDLRADWATPGVSLEHDARVARERDPAGYAILIGDDATVLVHPQSEGRGLGTVLRRWAEARAAERGTAVLRQYAYGSGETARRHLRAAGYEATHHYVRLRTDLAAAPAARPTVEVGRAAPGLRTFELDRDETQVHDLVQRAFADIGGEDHEPLERWRARRIAKDGWDPALWLLLDDADGLAGAALGERSGADTGYVTELAVAARARGRGHGRALLLGLFEAFRRAGLEHAELSVHGHNRGALRLYQSVGMRATWEADRWEKALG